MAILLLATTKRFGDEEARSWLVPKLLLVAGMVFGVWLVS